MDRRRRRVVRDSDLSRSLNEYIKTTCLDIDDGCACGEKRNHIGSHKCAASNCDYEWINYNG